MTAEIGITQSGVAEMAYVGEVPWHGLGQKLEEGASIGVWSREAGMDWEILEAPAGGMVGTDFRPIDGKKMLFRSDTLDPLSVVGTKYVAVQPIEVLQFFDDVAESAGLKLHTAGTLFGGKRFWALARATEDKAIRRDDQVGGYLLLATSCDGTMATEARWTTIRVVCNNTLQLVRKGAGQVVRTFHNRKFDTKEVRQELGIAQEDFAGTMAFFRKLADREMPKAEMVELTQQLLGVEKRTRTVDAILEVAEHGIGNHGETAWDWLNGVTEWTDHEAKAKTTSHRLNSAWFSYNAATKAKALELATTLV